jgi:hypothetical protein
MVTSELRLRLRFALFAAVGIFLAYAGAAEVLQSFELGVAEWGIRRKAVILSIARAENEIGFIAIVMFWAAFSMGNALFALWAIRCIFGSKPLTTRPLVTQVFENTERMAPSGLKPLVIGLAIFFVCFAAYVVAS